jgi:5-(carboxyamino)imidazole ribonucleotide synthase
LAEAKSIALELVEKLDYRGLLAVCGLPLGSVEMLSPSVMLNVLGDMWHPELDTDAIVATERAKLHLYGKSDFWEHRKMGHINFVGTGDLVQRAEGLKDRLLGL